MLNIFILPQSTHMRVRTKRESEKIKDKNNSYHRYLKLVGLGHFLRNKERKVAGIFWRVCQVSRTV